MSISTTYEEHDTMNGVPIKSWTKGVPFEHGAREQLENIARLPFIHGWVAAMPDVHRGIGATVGSVLPLVDAVIPAAVGVDIGCGMMAIRTNMLGRQLPDNLATVRDAIERTTPVGRGRWRNDKPREVQKAWAKLEPGFNAIRERHLGIGDRYHYEHLGTLGGGNHFIELCLDEEERVWIMLHTGSRGVGNRIGSYFIELAKNDMRGWRSTLPDENLSYFREGTEYFDDYVMAVNWAQEYAAVNRQVMMDRVLKTLRLHLGFKFQMDKAAINCHHNYVKREHHFGKHVWLTRKGAVSAQRGELGIIPGSMGARSYIVRGLGNKESFCSCSHGAGRVMSRTEAKRRVSLDEHIKATEGVECRKDSGVIDETPAAYKDIDSVMHAQKDLVEIVHTLKQVVCIKG